jgi:hypothetical protein
MIPTFLGVKLQILRGVDLRGDVFDQKNKIIIKTRA